MNVKGRWSEGEGERKDPKGGKRTKICCMYLSQDSIMRPTKHCEKREKGERG
jgi:hypothetical protein